MYPKSDPEPYRSKRHTGGRLHLNGIAIALRLLGCIALASGPLAIAAPTPKPVPEPAMAAVATAADREQNWPSHGNGPFEQRYSPLRQINRASVHVLGLAWSFPLGSHRGVEATPIVVDGIIYVTTPWSRVFAIDADSHQQIWFFDPKVDGAKGRDACCDVVNRGVAVSRGKVFLGALDGRLIALNARTGARIWSVQTTPQDKPYTITGAPRVVGDRVVIGNGGAEFGVRGYFSAYDLTSGKLLWRFYTVPPPPDEALEHPALELARRTWPTDSSWETGLGGTVWDSFAYDPELNLLYVGVGNSSLYNRSVRSPGGGDNLFLASILAIDPEDGRLVWHYQTTPGESWDYTATQHMILADLTLLGSERKVLMQAPKNGFFYVLDRETGELLSANNYVPVNWASGIDLETGRPLETGKGDWSKRSRRVMPGPFGGHNWHPMAYSPQTNLVYLPTTHGVYPYTPDPNYRYNKATFNTGEDWVANSRSALPILPPLCAPQRLTAWDPKQQKMVWEVDFSRAIPAGVLATAGGLVFQGTTDGRLVAYDALDGQSLWQQQVNVGIMAPPVSYSRNGKQTILVAAGLGGSSGGHSDLLDNLNPGYLFAFTLGGQAKAPDPGIPERKVHITRQTFDPDSVSQGEALYATHCMRCHGLGARASGLYPDLRFSSAATHDIWTEIVLQGLYRSRGMASFADVLKPVDVNAIHAYVIQQALASESMLHRALQSVSQQMCIPAEWLAD